MAGSGPRLGTSRLVIAAALGILLSTACATMGTYRSLGVRDKGRLDLVRVLKSGDALLFEFKAEPGRPPELHWARVGMEELFRTPSSDALSWKLKDGAVPEDLSPPAAPLPPCLAVVPVETSPARQRGARSLGLRDGCGGRERRAAVYFNRDYVTRAPWRPLALPLALPFTLAFDIVSFPVVLIAVLLAQ